MGNLIDLTKKAGIVLEKKNLVGVQAQIVLAIDRSGSMMTEYHDGTVQEIVDRLLGIGMNMDVDKSIDVFAFDHEARHVGVATQSNHSNFVRDKKMTVGGSTNYAPVMNMIINEHSNKPASKGFLGFGKKEATVAEHPVLVFFITDGDNFDKSETERLIKQCSNQPIFWQFVGIGRAGFAFLDKLDNMGGRVIDNANFFKVPDVRKISDEQLYDNILDEFPSWLKEAKGKGFVK